MSKGAAQGKVCQTDKCSAHNDKKKCSDQTVRKTISHKPTSSIFISIERRQTINLLSFPPVAAHVQMAALAGDFYLDKTVELSRKKITHILNLKLWSRMNTFVKTLNWDSVLQYVRSLASLAEKERHEILWQKTNWQMLMFCKVRAKDFGRRILEILKQTNCVLICIKWQSCFSVSLSEFVQISI